MAESRADEPPIRLAHTSPVAGCFVWVVASLLGWFVICLVFADLNEVFATRFWYAWVALAWIGASCMTRAVVVEERGLCQHLLDGYVRRLPWHTVRLLDVRRGFVRVETDRRVLTFSRYSPSAELAIERIAARLSPAAPDDEAVGELPATPADEPEEMIVPVLDSLGRIASWVEEPATAGAAGAPLPADWQQAVLAPPPLAPQPLRRPLVDREVTIVELMGWLGLQPDGRLYLPQPPATPPDGIVWPSALMASAEGLTLAGQGRLRWTALHSIKPWQGDDARGWIVRGGNLAFVLLAGGHAGRLATVLQRVSEARNHGCRLPGATRVLEAEPGVPSTAISLVRMDADRPDVDRGLSRADA